MKILLKLSLLVCLCLTTSCARELLTIHTDYLTSQSLASYHVETPDARLENPPLGQSLVFSWSLPKEYLFFPDLHLAITVRLRNREELKWQVALYRASGTYVYKLIDRDYFDSGGIFTYKVDLIGDQQVLSQWRHQMWTELILFKSETPLWDLDDENREEIGDSAK